MEKRLILAIFITVLFLIGYNLFVSKFYPQKEPPPPPKIEQADEEQKVFNTEQKPPLGEPEASPSLPQETPDESLFPEAHFEDISITYSPTGGYIKKVTINEYDEPLLFSDVGYVPEEKDVEFTPSLAPNRLIFTAPTGERKTFIFEGYTITIVFSQPPSSLILFSNRLSEGMLDQRYQEFFYSRQGNIQRKNLKSVRNAQFSNVEFAGARNRYFCASLLKGTYDIQWIKPKDTEKGKKEKVYVSLPQPPREIAIYVGPQTRDNLQPFELQGIIYFGIFHVIAIAITKLLNFFYSFAGNWGISIILLSIAIYLFLFPFTMKSTKAMRKMQMVQPQVTALRAKYKDNPQKLNKEILELYRHHKVNPLGGCLPLFFQLPVFFALYQILLRFVNLKGAEFLWITDLSQPDHAFRLPTTIPLVGEYINILPLLIMALGLLQQKLTASASSAPEQKQMGLFFALFIGVIFYHFPSCLVLYWFVQNLFTLLYQFKMSRVRQTVSCL